MRERVVETIRKLLQTARGKGPEAEIAAERAEHLMHKYGVHVSINELKKRVDGVYGFYWKEHLLFAAARVHRCRVLKSTTRQKYVVLSGNVDADVRAAYDLFMQMLLQASVECRRQWRQFLDGIVPRGDYLSMEDLDSLSPSMDDVFPYANEERWSNEILGEMLQRSPQMDLLLRRRLESRRPLPTINPPLSAASLLDCAEGEKVFARAFLANAAVTVNQRLAPQTKRKRAADAFGPSPEQQAKSAAKAEVETIVVLATKLAAKLGVDAEDIKLMIGTSERAGAAHGRTVRWTRRQQRQLVAGTPKKVLLLAKVSSFLPLVMLPSEDPAYARFRNLDD